jgi:hypothetical protein
MPDTFAQWCWFAFYSIGALGGWAFVGLVVVACVQLLRIGDWSRRHL